MQISHHAYFLERLLFNAARVYSSQLNKGDIYKEIQPVYAISIMDDILVGSNNNCVQTYSMINHDKTDERANGLHLVALELAKCRKMRNLDMEKPLDRWIQYFINPEYYLAMEKQELEKMPFQMKAVEILDTTNFTPGQMRTYDQYIDSVRLHNTIMVDAWERGITAGKEEGIQQGIAEGKAEGLQLSVLILEELRAGIQASVIAENYNVEPALVDTAEGINVITITIQPPIPRFNILQLAGKFNHLDLFNYFPGNNSSTFFFLNTKIPSSCFLMNRETAISPKNPRGAL